MPECSCVPGAGAKCSSARAVIAASSIAGHAAARLPVRTCGEPNAICVDNQPLTAPISATVQGVPLTAQFRNVPQEHDGETPFEMQFVLSEEPADLSYRTVHNNLFDASGGHIVRAWRLEVESTMTGVYPYARVDLNERVSAWGLVGIGSGELTLRQKDQDPMETDLGMRMGALGVKGQVLDGSGPSGIGVNIKSDAMWVRTTSDRTQGMESAEGDVSRLRLILEAERQFAMEGGGTFVPSGEVGVRVDGGDAETGTGLELGAGMRYARGPITIEGQVQALVAHEASGYEEWGASGAIRVNPSESGRGLTFAIVPVWGSAGRQAERLWGARDARELGQDAKFDATARIEAELGYGMSVPRTRGVVTPYAGLSVSEGSSRTYRAGTRWNLAEGAVLGLEGSREEGVGGNAPTESITFRTELRW